LRSEGGELFTIIHRPLQQRAVPDHDWRGVPVEIVHHGVFVVDVKLKLTYFNSFITRRSHSVVKPAEGHRNTTNENIQYSIKVLHIHRRLKLRTGTCRTGHGGSATVFLSPLSKFLSTMSNPLVDHMKSQDRSRSP
jgi:hypothetical protein